jgi:hypothetical protein
VDAPRYEWLLASQADDEIEERGGLKQPAPAEPSAAHDLHGGLGRVIHELKYTALPDLGAAPG